MKALNKSILQYGDENYKYAVNYSEQLYNYPITLNYGNKHDRAKYILSAGTCDHITLINDGVYIYVVSQNNGLSYIAMQVINTESKTVEGDTFLGEFDCLSEDCFSYGILNMDTEEQIKILNNYIN